MSHGAESPSPPSSAKVLSASYLGKHKGKNDLVRRLTNIASILREDETAEVDNSEFPGLASLVDCLVKKDYLEHKDKEVRLHTVLCCMEIFAVYAPEAPWGDSEICKIFSTTITQLGNLAHTTSPSNPNYENYIRILNLLAVVKIGVVLVDLAKNYGHDNDYDIDDNPVELLAELFQTTLQSLRPIHSTAVSDLVYKMITSCLEEYYGGIAVPFPLVEEILISVGSGPTLFVTNPAMQSTASNKKGKKVKKTPQQPLQVEKPNPSYWVASKVIRHNLDGLSTPIANLLNGLINGEARVVQRSSISAEEDRDEGNNENETDVWTIIYEVGKISPSVLTTIIGTVTNCLTSEDGKRHKAVELLGKLFCAKGSQLASKFGPSFRKWLQRYQDVEEETRLVLLHCLVEIIKTNKDSHVVHDCQVNLARMVEYDKAFNVRKRALEEICDYAFNNDPNENNENPVSIILLKAVGGRVKSKNAEERMAALTGLAQLYFHNYIRGVVSEIEKAGDDCDVELISRVLTENCSNTCVFGKGDNESSTKDTSGLGKYRFMVRLIFQCLCFSDSVDSKMRSRLTQIIDDLILGANHSKSARKKLSPTGRVVGLAVCLDCLREDSSSNSYNFMLSFFRQRAGLQKALGAYIDARSNARKQPQDSEAAALAMKKLKDVSKYLPPPGNKNVLESFHSAKDQHIFRTLSILTNSSHTRASRIRALEDLPKRTKSLGDDVTEWTMALVKRCSGGFFTADVVHDSIRLAERCLSEGDTLCASALLANANVATGIFPSLVDEEESFSALKSMTQQAMERRKKSRSQIAQNEMLTCLLSLLARVARAVQNTGEAIESENFLDLKIRKQLLHLCTGEGTPRQARISVTILATLFTERKGSGETIDDQAFTWLLMELTRPSKMSITSDDEQSAQLITILASLSALVERAPVAFSRSAKGDSAWKFAMEKVLLGRGDEGGDSESDSSDEEDATPQKGSRKRKKGVQHKSPVGKTCLLESSELSFACRRVVAAIEFLVTNTRSTVLAANYVSDNDRAELPSDEHLRGLFDILSQMIRDKGVAPSRRDRILCRSRQDRAAIRQCTAVHLLQLCSFRLRLDGKYLTNKMWQMMGDVVLDEEKVVREAMIEELTAMMNGVGFYSNEVPRLRFVALTSLCADGDARFNGNAANVGNHRSNAARVAATRCFGRMRTALQDSASSQTEDDESREDLKAQFMPENVIPFAFHLLAFRRESPSVKLPESASETSQHRMLTKRLKLLFQALVQSLNGGSSAQISFLYNMTLTLSGQDPIDVVLSRYNSPPNDAAKVLSQAKIGVICDVARELLMESYVKTDESLSHPAKIRVPTFLFHKRSMKKRSAKKSTPDSTASKRAKTGETPKSKSVPEEVNFLSDGEAGSGEAALESPGVSPILKVGSPGGNGRASPDLSEQEKSLSPDSNGAATSTAKAKRKRASGRVTPAESSPSSVLQQTQESISSQENEGKRTEEEKATNKASASRRSNRKRCSDIGDGRVKPLGDSNRALKAAKKRSKSAGGTSSRRSPRLIN